MPSFSRGHFESDVLLYGFAHSSRLDSNQNSFEISSKFLCQSTRPTHKDQSFSVGAILKAGIKPIKTGQNLIKNYPKFLRPPYFS